MVAGYNSITIALQFSYASSINNEKYQLHRTLRSLSDKDWTDKDVAPYSLY